MDLDVWACPVCLARISPGNDGVVCTREGRRFPLLNGLPVLLRPEDTSLLEDSERYSAAWIRETWTPSKTDLVRLPYIPHGQWRQKARSLKVLLRLLGPPKGRIVADMGAGTGWLSHRLSEAGFRCFATDLSTDLVVGLGAAEAFSGTSGEFERAVASLERWPFQNGTIDLAVCNASLHYLAEIGPALREAARVLRPGGEFVAMNDPVQRDRRSAERAAKECEEVVAEGTEREPRAEDCVGAFDRLGETVELGVHAVHVWRRHDRGQRLHPLELEVWGHGVGECVRGVRADRHHVPAHPVAVPRGQPSP